MAKKNLPINNKNNISSYWINLFDTNTDYGKKLNSNIFLLKFINLFWYDFINYFHFIKLKTRIYTKVTTLNFILGKMFTFKYLNFTFIFIFYFFDKTFSKRINKQKLAKHIKLNLISKIN